MSTPPAAEREPNAARESGESGQQAVGETARDGRPSPRDRAIYERHVLRGETQDAVAADQKCSRQRVSQICRKVEHWLAANADDELAAALRVRCQRRLDVLYVDALRQFERSKQDLVTERERTSHRVPDGQPDKGVTTTVSERVRRQQNGDARFLNAALRAVERMKGMIGESGAEGNSGADGKRGARNAKRGVGPSSAARSASASAARPAPAAPAWYASIDPLAAPSPPDRGASAPLAHPTPVAPPDRGVSVPLAPAAPATGRHDEQPTTAAVGSPAVLSSASPAPVVAPRSELGTPHSVGTPHSPQPASPQPAPTTPLVNDAPRASPPPERDTILIVGAPREVPEMRTFAESKLAGYQIVTRTSLAAVAHWLKKNLDSTALISLDDDMGDSRLELGELVRPGTMVEVAREVARYRRCCPVVLNTSGPQCKRLSAILQSAGWDTHWTKPTGGHWLKQDWLRAVKRQLPHGRPGAAESGETARKGILHRACAAILGAG
ncbi:MAG: hypothetical protein ACREJM_01120 [Candidatus Saccharimonadales bacterium]